MIGKVVQRHVLGDPAAARRDLVYWVGRSPAERLAAVEMLRRWVRGCSARLQRTDRVVQQTLD